MSNKPDAIKATNSVGIIEDISVFEREVWNKAIEAAAMCQRVDVFVAMEIRKLKK